MSEFAVGDRVSLLLDGLLSIKPGHLGTVTRRSERDPEAAFLSDSEDCWEVHVRWDDLLALPLHHTHLDIAHVVEKSQVGVLNE